jgi:uncharacterized RDD family membrane protein YckC
MNIKQLFIHNKADEQKKYASSFARSIAGMFDIVIVLILRIVAALFLGNLWLNGELIRFREDFTKYFGTEIAKNTPEHLDFILSHRVFICALIFYALIIMVGAIYHSYFNSSKWQATIGKRLMNILIVKENDEKKIGLGLGLLHYFLSIVPFVYVFYILSFQIRYKMSLFHAVTANNWNMFFGIVFVVWLQTHLFTRKKITAYDMICRTVFLNGKTQFKWPWSK